MEPGTLVKFIDGAPDNHLLDSLITILSDCHGPPPYFKKIGLVISKKNKVCKVLFYNMMPGEKRVWSIGEHALVKIT